MAICLWSTEHSVTLKGLISGGCYICYCHAYGNGIGGESSTHVTFLNLGVYRSVCITEFIFLDSI